MRGRAHKLALCGLFAGATAIAAQIIIPIGAIPISLATFAVFLSGILLGAKLGMVSQLVYVLVGAVGLPVFAGFRGGLSALVGPTGGYLLSYILVSLIIGFILDGFGRKISALIFAVIIGWVFNIVLGSAWYMILMRATLIETLTVCVVPFILGDAAKIALAVSVGYKLYPKIGLTH